MTTVNLINGVAYRALLDFLMADDPTTIPHEARGTLEYEADLAARRRGYADWVDAYHNHDREDV